MKPGTNKKVNPIMFGIFSAICITAILSLPMGLVPQEWLSTDARVLLLCAIGTLLGLYMGITEQQKQANQ